MNLLTLAEVAERLSFSVGQVRRLVKAGDLSHVRLGRRAIRVQESDLADYVTRHRSTAKSA